MTSGLTEPAPAAPVLVLGLGNTLLVDDGVGPQLVEELTRLNRGWEGRVEFLDGGTQGLALLGFLDGRSALVLLDALSVGAEPGSVSVLQAPQLRDLGARRANTAHEGNAGELLAAATLVNGLPPRVVVVGVEPKNLAIGSSLSEAVRRALPGAVARTEQVIEEILLALREAA